MTNVSTLKSKSPIDESPDLAATLEAVERTFPRIAARLLFDVAADSPLWDLPLPQVRALHMVAHRRGCSVGHLAERLGVAMSTATQIADRLEQRGWIRRVDDPEDRRVVRLALTDEGRRVVEERRHQRHAQLCNALARMAVEKRVALVEGLQALFESVACGGTAHACRHGSSLLEWVREDLESGTGAEEERSGQRE